MRFVRSLLKIIAYCVAFGIVLAALFSIVVRETTPLLNEYRSDFEAFVSQTLNVPVHIKNVRVSWRQYQPVIDVGEVTFHNKETGRAVLAVNRVTLFFSLPSSIWQHKVVVGGILIDGAEVSVSQSESGEYTIRELSSLGLDQLGSNQDTSFNDVVHWLSTIPKLILRNIDLHLSLPKQPQYFVTLNDFRIRNRDGTHHVSGKGVLHQAQQTEISMAASWQGTILDWQTVTGKVYVDVLGISLPQWLDKHAWHDMSVSNGSAGAKVWLTVSRGVVDDVQAQLDIKNITLVSSASKQETSIKHVSGDFGWKQHDGQMILAADNLFIELSKHVWPMTSFYLALKQTPDGGWQPKQFNMLYFDMRDLRMLLQPVMTLIPKDWHRLINDVTWGGGIQSLAVSFADDWKSSHGILLKGKLNQLSYQSVDQSMILKNMSGDVVWRDDVGSVQLNSARFSMLYPAVFKNDLYFDQVNGQLTIRPENGNWLIQAENMQLLNRDLALSAKGQLRIPEQGTPVADVSAHFSLQQAARVSRYLPLAIFDASLVEWLQQAFLAGEVQEGEALLRGPLNAFPFDHGEGEFAIRGRVNHVDFRFAPTWPTLDKIDGRIAFIGRRIEVSVDRAETLGIKTNGVQGVIARVGDEKGSILDVEMKPIDLDFTQGIHYLFKSPLNDTIGMMFKGMALQGPANLTLNLRVPLSQPNNTSVKGDLSFKRSHLTLVPYQLSLDELTGSLSFTESSISATQINALLFKKPFSFDLATEKTNSAASVVKASFNHTLAIDDIERWLKLNMSTYLQGETQVSGQIGIAFSKPIQIDLQSNLMGLAVTLDPPFGKPKDSNKAFSMSMLIEERAPIKMKVHYGDDMNAALILDQSKGDLTLKAMDLRFGNDMPPWPSQPGLSLSGQFDVLDMKKINSYVDQANRRDDAASLLPVNSVNVSANKLVLEALTLTSVNVKATPNEKEWLVDLDSNEIKGSATIPKVFNQKGTISATIQKAHLTHGESRTPIDTSWDVTQFPGLHIQINDLSINNMALGKLTFIADPKRNGLDIKTLSLQSPWLSLSATGDWVRSSRNTQTRITGSASSPNVTSLLRKLGFHADNFEASRGDVNYKFSWAGAPHDVSIAGLTGQVSLRLRAGRIVDVGQGGGAKMDLARMLSLFSLQTIPRRLSLNFSDVFQKGYSFDSLVGDVLLEEGDLYTRNLHFDGPVARLNIKGRIGLTEKDYDLRLGVVPHVTSTIPVAATLLTGNPLVGVGAFVVNALVGSKVSKATGYDYTITGPWDNPNWQSVQAPN